MNIDTTIQPTAPAAIEVSRITFREMITDNPNIQKPMTPEFYYTTTVLPDEPGWARMRSLTAVTAVACWRAMNA